MTLPTISQLGRIRAKDGWTYQLTPDDVLWLARSAKFEGGSKPATLWTYAQRLANRHGSSMAALVRAHSQPVNPAWDEATDAMCISHPDQCTPDQLARRQQAESAPWESLSSAPTVMQWAQAKLSNPAPRATDFAADIPARAGRPAHLVATNFLRRHPDAVLVLDAGNKYIAEGPSSAPSSRPAPTSWPADFVTIEYQGQVAGPAGGGILGPALGLLGLALAWKWFA